MHIVIEIALGLVTLVVSWPYWMCAKEIDFLMRALKDYDKTKCFYDCLMASAWKEAIVGMSEKAEMPAGFDKSITDLLEDRLTSLRRTRYLWLLITIPILIETVASLVQIP